MSFYSCAITAVNCEILDNQTGLIDRKTFIYPLFVEATTEEEAIGICFKHAHRRFPVGNGYENHVVNVHNVDKFILYREVAMQEIVTFLKELSEEARFEHQAMYLLRKIGEHT